MKIELPNLTFERRRYGTQMYTWVYAQIEEGGKLESLGDPWPCITPKRSEIAEAIETVKRHKTDAATAATENKR